MIKRLIGRLVYNQVIQPGIIAHVFCCQGRLVCHGSFNLGRIGYNSNVQTSKEAQGLLFS